jgi:hypothetical protein
MKLTRRELAGAVVAPVLAAQGSRPEPAVLEKESQAALDAVRRTSETLAEYAVPADLEPAFQFKA